jgi:hypothetical protein
MAISIISPSSDKISVEEFIDFIESQVDIENDESIISASDMLQSLANNKEALIEIFNNNLLKFDCERSRSYYQSSTILGAGRKKPFIVRANLWPPIVSATIRTVEESLFSYELAHDHNFNFLTANYFGPGYETDIWENLNPDMQPEVGKLVAMKFLERTTLHPNKLIYFRRKKDIHIQHPPKDFSASLNLLVTTKNDSSIEQLIFNMKNSKIDSFPVGSISSKRIFVIQAAGQLGNENTADILFRIAKRHPCLRTRSAALSSAMHIIPSAEKNINNGESREIYFK